MICGAYEGVDERVRQELADDELSIGDYVLTNGSLAAMVLIDAMTRLLPGALGDDQSSLDESFSQGLLEYPHYTRPAEFRGLKVPARALVRQPCGDRKMAPGTGGFADTNAAAGFVAQEADRAMKVTL